MENTQKKIMPVVRMEIAYSNGIRDRRDGTTDVCLLGELWKR